jgi:pantoate--beta-alanine ligase
MEIIEAPREMQALVARWRCEGETIGFVPTMGALHEGHLSLARVARQECSKFVASVFVNPTQFGPSEDLERYPRPFERDSQLLQEAGCDAIFAPTVGSMYGGDGHGEQDARTFVEVSKLSNIWEGAVRPGHLRGVATVVTMLFNILSPHRAYFGEKDYQQLKVIERMVHDLHFDLTLVPCPTVREPDGLAMSSRNAYLAPDEREAATVLYQALSACVARAGSGERDVAVLSGVMRSLCEEQPLVSLQYVSIVDADTLDQLQVLGDHPARALIAARVGSTRLIDNIALVAETST